jgi:hypothetical protein
MWEGGEETGQRCFKMSVPESAPKLTVVSFGAHSLHNLFSPQ